MSDTTTVKLYDDENFTAKDRIMRELIYLPLDPNDPVVDHGKVVQMKFIRINLTNSHFTEKGAVSFKDLTPESYNLYNAIWDGLAYATGKKKKISTSTNKSKGRKSGRSRTNRGDDDGDDEESHIDNAADTDKDASSLIIDGNAHIRVYIEPLLTMDTRQVNGYRIDIYDTSADSATLDLVTRGINESMLASKKIQKLINDQQQKNNTQQQQQRSKQPTNVNKVEISKKYQYTKYNTKDLFLGMINNYFLRDSLLLTMPNHNIVVKDERQHFIDERPFLKHNQRDGTVLGENDFSMSNFFDKEQAMFYYVELDNVCIDQRTRQRYYAPIDKRIEQQMELRRKEEDLHVETRDRLVRLSRDNLNDKEFHGYPFPNITHRIDNRYLSQEVMSEMVLPYRLGSYLYTEADRITVKEKMDQLKQQREINMDEEPSTIDEDDIFNDQLPIKTRAFMSQRELNEPIGIHHTEYEITTSVLQFYNNLLTDDLRRYATSPIIPNHIAHSFMSCMRNIVSEELQLMMNSVDSVKNDLIETKGLQFTPHYRVSTISGVINNADKNLLIDKRASKDYGMSPEAKEKELQKMLSMASLPYFRPILGKHRSPVANMSTARAMGKLKYDEVHMERDIYLVLDQHNEGAHQTIKSKYYDKNNRIKEGKKKEFDAEKHEFIIAAVVEMWDEFLNHPEVTLANQGIRDDLKRNKDGILGDCLPLNKYNIRARSYHQYKLWNYGFFADIGAINHHYKVMDAIYFAKFHHCRYYVPGCKDPKLYLAMLGVGMGGKTHRLNIVERSCPTGVCIKMSHTTANFYNTGGNLNDFLVINDEMPATIFGDASGKTDVSVDNVRNQAKERMTGGETLTGAFHTDDEGNRMIKFFKCQCQGGFLGASNMRIEETADASISSRIFSMYVPRSMYDTMGNTANDKDKAESGRSIQDINKTWEEHKQIHRVYYIMECIVKSGILGDNTFGLEVEGARTIIKKTLDRLHTEYRIPTNDPRKRKAILEMARCKALAHAVWIGLTDPKHRHLFYDPYDPTKYIGFNPRVIIYAIMPEMVIKIDHVLDSLSCLSCLWGHEYQGKVLENIATKRCELHKLRDADFLRRDRHSKQPIDGAPLLSSHMVKNTTKRPYETSALSDDWVIDYNYIVIQSKSHEDIHKVLSGAVGELHISESDVKKIFSDLKQQRIKTDGYIKKDGRLVASGDDHQIADRPVLDYGYDPLTKNAAIAFSTAFLRQKLSHLFANENSLIDDLTCFSFREIAEDDEDGNESEMNNIIIDEYKKTNQPILEKATSYLLTPEHKRLEDALVINRGDANETSIIAAFKDVMENEIYAFTGDYTKEEEDEIMNDYRDVMNGELPTDVFVTSEYPLPLPVASTIPELPKRYQYMPNAIKDISLVNIPAVIRLRRLKNKNPFVMNNHTTISPMTRASLSIYNQSDMEVEENGKNLAVQENRVLAYSNIASIRVDKDIDWIYCNEFLDRIGFPAPRKDGFLINYSPHQYMSMIRHKDEEIENKGSTTELVKPYLDILDKVRTTKEMIETELGIKTNRTTTISQYMKLNIHESDHVIEKIPVSALKRKRGHQEKEKNNALNNFADMMKNYNIPNLINQKDPISLKRARLSDDM